tara:strand:+ start:799 stop:939 length:141 start_codon:yes stop_codon:yes gene_type:complete
MKFVIYSKDRYKDRSVKVGHTDTIKKLEKDGWEKVAPTKAKKKKKA